MRLITTVLFLCTVFIPARAATIMDDVRLDVRTGKTWNTYFATGTAPRVICDSLGSFTVIWQAPDGLRAVRYNADGSIAVTERELAGDRTDRIFCNEQGAFAVVYELGGGLLEITRYRADLTPKDAVPIRDTSPVFPDVGYRMYRVALGLDRAMNMMVATTEEDVSSGNRQISFRYYRNGTLMGGHYFPVDISIGSFTVQALQATGTEHFLAFITKLEHGYDTYYQKSRLRTKPMVGTASGPEFAGDDHIFAETGKDEFAYPYDWPIQTSSVYRWNGAAAVFNDTTGLTAVTFDAAGTETHRHLIAPHGYQRTPGDHAYRTALRASTKGGYAIVYEAGVDSLCLNWAVSHNNTPSLTDELTHPADNADVALDGLHRRIVAWSQDNAVYALRTGGTAIAPFRINGDGAAPRAARSALSTDGSSMYTAWVPAGDTLVLARYPAGPYPGGPELVHTGPTLPKLDMPCLTAFGALHHRAAGGDTLLQLLLTNRAAVDTALTVSSTSARPGRAVMARNSGNILVVWEDFRNGPGDDARLFCQLFSEDGRSVASNRVLCDGLDPRITASPQGGFAVTFTRTYTRITTVQGIPVIRQTAYAYLMYLNSGGSISMGPVLLDETGIQSAYTDICAAGPYVLAAWYRPGASGGMRARSFRDTTAVHAAVTFTNGPATARRPFITAVAGSSAVIAWADAPSGGIQYQPVAYTAEPYGDAGSVYTDSLTAYADPSLCLSSCGDTVLATWLAPPRTGFTYRRMLGDLFTVAGGTVPVNTPLPPRNTANAPLLRTGAGNGRPFIECVLPAAATVRLTVHAPDGTSSALPAPASLALAKGTHRFTWPDAAAGTGIYVVSLQVAGYAPVYRRTVVVR